LPAEDREGRKLKGKYVFHLRSEHNPEQIVMRTTLSLCAIAFGVLLIGSAGIDLVELFVTPAHTCSLYDGFCGMVGNDRLSILFHDIALSIARVRLSLPDGLIFSIGFYLSLIMGGLALGEVGSRVLNRATTNKQSGTSLK
jgi:hypothetical protein